MNSYVPTLTKHGQTKLQDEYETLKNTYMKITAELRRVGAENLDDAFTTSVKKVEQLFLEDKIKRIQDIMNRMKIVKNKRRKNYADVGSKVTYQHNNQARTITLVDPLEADPSVGFIPIDSPLGKAILGKRINKNKTIIVTAPRLTYQITLLKIN